MSDFDKVLAFTLTWEGGYVNDPADPGGETKYGISKKAYPSLNIANLTKEQAAEIYKRDYWDRGKCDKLPYPANIVHFDCCVNVGLGQSAKILQRAAGIDDDGIIGPNTLQAANNDNPQFLALSAITERDLYYEDLVNRRPALLKYINGWKNRTEALRAIIT